MKWCMQINNGLARLYPTFLLNIAHIKRTEQAPPQSSIIQVPQAAIYGGLQQRPKSCISTVGQCIGCRMPSSISPFVTTTTNQCVSLLWVLGHSNRGVVINKESRKSIEFVTRLESYIASLTTSTSATYSASVVDTVFQFCSLFNNSN